MIVGNLINMKREKRKESLGVWVALSFLVQVQPLYAMDHSVDPVEDLTRKITQGESQDEIDKSAALHAQNVHNMADWNLEIYRTFVDFVGKVETATFATKDGLLKEIQGIEQQIKLSTIGKEIQSQAVSIFESWRKDVNAVGTTTGFEDLKKLFFASLANGEYIAGSDPTSIKANTWFKQLIENQQKALKDLEGIPSVFKEIEEAEERKNALANQKRILAQKMVLQKKMAEQKMAAAKQMKVSEQEQVTASTVINSSGKIVGVKK